MASSTEKTEFSVTNDIEKVMGSYKIVLAPTWEIAQTVKADATVEAEYGEKVANGSISTLAHHGARTSNPAPCNTEVEVLPKGSVIMLSHVDLDALGGVMALAGVKPEDPGFWKAAEYIDVHGPHHMHELGQKEQDQLNAVWAWKAEQPRAPFAKELTDVGSQLIPFAKAVAVATEPKHPDHDKMIEDGKRWEKETAERVNACLVEENSAARLFRTDGSVFCSASYYSPEKGEIIPATVQYNEKFKSITLAFAEDIPGLSAEKIMQDIFGPEAGGRAGIAGTPRGHEYTMEDAHKVHDHVTKLLMEKQIKKADPVAGLSAGKKTTVPDIGRKKAPFSTDINAIVGKATDQAIAHKNNKKIHDDKSKAKDSKSHAHKTNKDLRTI